MNKFTLAIMVVGPIVVLTVNFSTVQAQVLSSARALQTFTQDRALSPQKPCYADNDVYNRQALSEAAVARSDAPGKQPSASRTLNSEDTTTLGIEELKDSCGTPIAFLRENERRARNELTGNVKSMFLSDIGNLEGLVNRFTRVVAGLEYGARFKHAYETHNGAIPDPQDYQLELAVYETAKNADKYEFAQAAIREGVQIILVRMFPRTAPLFNESVVTISSSTLVNITSFLDNSGSKGNDPKRIIRDKSGAFSMDEKRHALYWEWARLDQNDLIWNRQMVKNLVEETEIVYLQSVPTARR